MSIRNKLILNVALVHLVLISVFVADTLYRQREFLLYETRDGAVNFAQLLSENVLSWVLAEDLMGMDEVLQASARMLHASYACVVAPNGQVLAHTDREKVGTFLVDPESLQLLSGSKKEAHVWRDDPLHVHAAAPLEIHKNQVGWVLVGRDMSGMAEHLRELRNKGLIYTLLAIIIGAFCAWLLSCAVFRQLGHIMGGIRRLRHNDFSSSIPVCSNDEFGHMATALNQASDVLLSSRNVLRGEIRERMEAEKQIRELTCRLVDGNEEERKRLGHDLHDELGQSVTGLLFGLHALKKLLRPDETEARTLCEQLINESKRFGDDVRRVAASQYPVVLERLGLAAEAPALLSEISERTPYLDLNFSIDLPKERLHPRIEASCYRILQEAMANVLRHSEASRVWVELSTMKEWVFLRIADNGKGFAAEDTLEQSAQYSGIGLLGMQARVLAVDGFMEVDSHPGQGCVIDVFLPLIKRSGEGSDSAAGGLPGGKAPQEGVKDA